MPFILILIAAITSIIGSICGIGGGVLIKPVLDAMTIMSVSAISFLSGCTVLSMALVSVVKNICSKHTCINKRTTPMLGAGAALGGVAGKLVFDLIRQAYGSDNLVGLIQAILLASVTFATSVYLILNQSGKIRSKRLQSIPGSIIIGLFLGIVSSFLGIGGGPINLAVLSYFFSIDSKESATNSLCIILISQSTSLIQTLITHSIPEFNPLYLAAVVAGGVIGGYIGQSINRHLSARQVRVLFFILLLLVIAICLNNALRYAKFCW